MESFTKGVKVFEQGANIFVDAAKALATIAYKTEEVAIGARVELLMADIEALSQKSLLAADLTAKAYTSAVNNSLSSVIDGVNEGAYASASNLIDLAAQSKIMGLEQERIDLENKNTRDVVETKKDAALSDLYAQSNEATATMVAESGRLIGHAANNVQVAAESAGELPGAIADAAANIAEGTAGALSSAIQAENALMVQRSENEKKVTERVLKSNQDITKKWIEAGANVEKAWLQFAQKIEGGLLKTEAASNSIGVGMGLNGRELNQFKHSLLDTQVVISKWGKTLADVSKLQEEYFQSTGRNVQFNNQDWDTTIAFDKLMGQDGLSTQLNANMDLFNHSVADSNEMFFEMYKTTSRIGLNAKRYMNDLIKNLKLAERYQFKGGVKGLMEMAKWAQNTRFNMDSLGGIIDDLHNGGLEGVITKAARMQVLGGRFAMGADPMAMLWESYMDPHAYAERQNQQISDTGYFDAATGEVKFGLADQMRIEAFAQASGQSKEDLFNQRRQAIKGERVVKNLSRGVNWSDEDKSLVTNKARLENGEWVVTMDDENTKSVSNLTQEDLNHLKPSSNEEKLVSYVYDIRDMMTRLAGAKTEATSTLERDTFDTWYQEELERIANVSNEFRANYQTYLNETLEKMRLATDAQQTMLDQMAAGNQNIDQASSEILQEGRNIANSLAEANRLIQSSLDEINRRKNEHAPQPGEIAYDHRRPTLRSTPYDVRWNTDWDSFRINGNNNQSASTSHVQRAQQAASQGDVVTAIQNAYPTGRGSIMDGVITSNNQPTYTVASSITPIHDGGVQLAESDPLDHALFAKVGGPFDTLFNGVFDKVEAIYQYLHKSEAVEPDDEASIMALSRILDSFNGSVERQYSIANQMRMQAFKQATGIDPREMRYPTEVLAPRTVAPSDWGGNSSNQGGQITFNQPLKIEIGGKIEIGMNGQSLDITKEIANNPQFIRQLTQLISEGISRNMNGGKTVYTGGQLVGGLGFAGS